MEYPAGLRPPHRRVPAETAVRDERSRAAGRPLADTTTMLDPEAIVVGGADLLGAVARPRTEADR